MPKIRINGAELYYEEHGPEDAPAILFAHGLLFSGRMFDAQVDALQDRYRCVTFDFRGQGRSATTDDGYTIGVLTDDAVAIIDALALAPCHFAGLSMGGFVGLRLAIRHPELLRSLILLETSADPAPPENVPRYRRLNTATRWLGLRAVSGRVMPIVFGRKFLEDPKRADLRRQWRQCLNANDRVGINRAVKGVIQRMGVYNELGKIDLPTLIIVGDQDVATVPEKSERMHAAIAGSELVTIPGAGHTSTVEEPEAVNAAIEAFLARFA